MELMSWRWDENGLMRRNFWWSFFVFLRDPSIMPKTNLLILYVGSLPRFNGSKDVKRF